MGQTGRERRRYPRAAVEIVIKYANTEQFFTDYAMNISLGGIFIKTATPFPINTRLSIHFSIPGLDRAIRTTGVVMRSSREPPAGMGVRFDDLDQESKAAIDSIVAS